MKKRFAFFSILSGVSLFFGSVYIRSCNRLHNRNFDSARAFDVSAQENQVVFAGPGQGEQDLWVLAFKNNQVRRLTNTSAFESSPAFAPDGKSVVYAAGEKERADHIFVSFLNGKGVKQLTVDDYNDREPSFSPNGQHIVFVRDTEYVSGGMMAWGTWLRSEIYSIKTDGTEMRKLTNNFFHKAFSPRFSPDGRTIVFSYASSVQEGNLIGILPFSEFGPIEKVRSLTAGGYSYSPALLPNNKHIAFFADTPPNLRGANNGLFQMDLIGHNSRQLIKSDKFRNPLISPKGNHIYFFMPPKHQLLRMDIDGRHLTKMADKTYFQNPIHWITRSEGLPLSSPINSRGDRG